MSKRPLHPLISSVIFGLSVLFGFLDWFRLLHCWFWWCRFLIFVGFWLEARWVGEYAVEEVDFDSKDADHSTYYAPCLSGVLMLEAAEQQAFMR